MVLVDIKFSDVKEYAATMMRQLKKKAVAVAAIELFSKTPKRAFIAACRAIAAPASNA